MFLELTEAACVATVHMYTQVRADEERNLQRKAVKQVLRSHFSFRSRVNSLLIHFTVKSILHIGFDVE